MIVFYVTTDILKLIDYYSTLFKIFPIVTEYHRLITVLNLTCLFPFTNDNVKKCFSLNSNLITHNVIWVSRDVFIVWFKTLQKAD